MSPRASAARRSGAASAGSAASSRGASSTRAPAGSSAKGSTPRSSSSKAPASTRPASKRPSAGTKGRRGRGGAPEVSFRQRQLETSRYGIVYDIDGPRVRLGVVWFVVALVSAYLGVVVWAVLLAAVAALAAAQTATVLRTRWRRPDRGAAAALAAAVVLAAAQSAGAAGAVLIVATVAVVVHAAFVRRKGTDVIGNAGAVVRAALAVGVAGAALVMLHRYDIGAAVTILLLGSAYEFGDFLVGTGASNRVEGPASGMLGVGVATAALAVASPPPFEDGTIWLFGALVALLAPAGQVLASAVLPRAGAPARALRRLDTYLVVAPVWVLLMWAGVHA